MTSPGQKELTGKGKEVKSMWSWLEDTHPVIYNLIVWGEILLSAAAIVISIIVLAG